MRKKRRDKLIVYSLEEYKRTWWTRSRWGRVKMDADGGYIKSVFPWGEINKNHCRNESAVVPSFMI